MDADWAAVWVALAALLISVVAALFTGLSTWYSRGHLEAARRQADVAEAALEFQKRVHELQAREDGPRAWRPTTGAGAPPPEPDEHGPPEPVAPAPSPAPTAPAPSDAPHPASGSDAGTDWMGADQDTDTPQGDTAFPRVSPWTVTHVRGDRYHLTNGSDHPAHDVAIEVGLAGQRPTSSERWERIDPGDPTSFRTPHPETSGDRALVVSWAWSPGGPRHEWVAELPARRH